MELGNARIVPEPPCRAGFLEGLSCSPALQRAGLAPLGLLLPLEVLLPSGGTQSLNPGITARALCHLCFPWHGLTPGAVSGSALWAVKCF